MRQVVRQYRETCWYIFRYKTSQEFVYSPVVPESDQVAIAFIVAVVLIHSGPLLALTICCVTVGALTVIVTQLCHVLVWQVTWLWLHSLLSHNHLTNQHAAANVALNTTVVHHTSSTTDHPSHNMLPSNKVHKASNMDAGMFNISLYSWLKLWVMNGLLYDKNINYVTQHIPVWHKMYTVCWKWE